MFGYAETAPRHILAFQLSNFEIWGSRHFVKMFDILRYLPCPWGVVALRGIQKQDSYFVEVENQGRHFSPEIRLRCAAITAYGSLMAGPASQMGPVIARSFGRVADFAN